MALPVQDSSRLVDVDDGVHINLHQDTYFHQRALGSTDLIKLWQKREGWWWTSRHNRRRRDVSSKYQLYGSAAHAIVLEGVEAYEERFAAAPDYDAIPGLITTLEKAKERLAQMGFKIASPSTKGWLKEDWTEFLADDDAFAVSCPYKPALELRFGRTIGERTVVSAEDDEMLRLMREVMLDPDRDDNQELRAIFGSGAGHPALAEVSVLHTLPNGLRRRWRIDRMFPGFDLDLKTLGNWQGRPLDWATGEMIAKGGYDIQRADYKWGRQVAYEYIRQGRIFGGDFDQRRWLSSWPDDHPTWDWVWLFYQKPDPVAGNAPVLFPIRDFNNSERERDGAVKALAAMRFYFACVEKWGLERPWARVEPVHYTDESRVNAGLPTVKFPHWIAAPEPSPEMEETAP